MPIRSITPPDYDDDEDIGTIEVALRRDDGTLPSVAELTDEIMHAVYLAALEPGQKPCPSEWEKNRIEITAVAEQMIATARKEQN